MTAGRRTRPGRDRRAVLHAAPSGRRAPAAPRHVVVIGGGIAGLAAATVLAEHGVRATLLEAAPRLGGRASSWPLEGGRTMSRGFHAFFRQYYNLRALLRRIDPGLDFLTAVPDYPLLRADGLRDSFLGVPRRPPWNLVGFVARSPSFTARALARVNVPAALGLLRARFPRTYRDFDGESAAEFLDRLRFPAAARDLALEVFARSFFAHPSEFSAAELVGMFHAYFLGSAEGLLFDVPRDDYTSTLWRPLGARLEGLGARVLTGTRATGIHVGRDGVAVTADGARIDADAAVLAVDPRSARALAAGMAPAESPDWHARVAGTRNAPPFAVVRLWLSARVRADRPAFLGTSGFGPVDNVSVIDRFEAGAAAWAARHGGSVVELHAYARADTDCPGALAARMEGELRRIYPETGSASIVHREVLAADDCPLFEPGSWSRRPGSITPWPRLVLAGDWIRCPYPVALMERAATTGFSAANALLGGWGVSGQDVWTVPMRGLLAAPALGRGRHTGGAEPV